MIAASQPTPEILSKIQLLGHTVFLEGAYNLNIIGARSRNPIVNSFCDRLHTVYRDESGSWHDDSWPITTDPGLYWLQNPMYSGGTAILKPGQYRGSHHIGMHRGEYETLIQGGKLTVYLDANRDNKLNVIPGSEITGVSFGINIHHAGAHSTQVDNWSAGCQVFANYSDWKTWMGIVYRAANLWGPVFTYTLITSDSA